MFFSTNVPGLKPRACEVCQRRDRVFRCAGCGAVHYCGRAHQASHRDSHKYACVAVKRARARLEREELQLRNQPADDLTMPPNVFENGVGHFWGILGTRPYMRARYGLVDALLEHFGPPGGRLDVVQAALHHLLDMLRLCRSDNMGLRSMIPALYVRLGRDQAAYDFMKWYATTGHDMHYDWGDMRLPFLDVKDADVLESPEGLWSNCLTIDLSFAITVTLIKVRLLLDLQAIQNATRALHSTVPQEILDLILGQLVGSVVQLAGGTDIARLIKRIKGQVGGLYRSIDEQNPYFWPSMLTDPAAAIADKPEAFSSGTPEETSLMLSYTFAAWAESPGAIDIIRTLSLML